MHDKDNRHYDRTCTITTNPRYDRTSRDNPHCDRTCMIAINTYISLIPPIERYEHSSARLKIHHTLTNENTLGDLAYLIHGEPSRGWKKEGKKKDKHHQISEKDWGRQGSLNALNLFTIFFNLR